MTRFRIVWAPLAVALALQVPATARADTASQVFDLWPGSDPGVPSFDAAVFDGRLCFRGRNDFAALDATGDELYCYDGTTVALAADVLPGATGSFPTELTVYAGQLYFSAANPFDDDELWRWDGVSPPARVFDLRPGASGSFPRELTVYDGQLYFSADADGASGGRSVWRYDSSQPTVVGTNPMAVQSFSTTDLDTPSDWIVFADVLFYPAPPGSGHGPELFRFDSSQPIVDGTNPRIVVDLDPGPPGSDPGDFTAHTDGNLYFTAVTATDVGRRLYRSNGNNLPTLVSTTLDIQSDLVSYDGDLLFFAQNQDLAELTGVELWRYDGTTFVRVEPGVEYLVGGPFGQIDGFLYFIAAQGNPLNGFDLYKVDGTGPPAPAVALFSTLGDANYPIFGFQDFDGLLYFNARTTAGGAELWAMAAEGGSPPPASTVQFSAAAYSAGEGDGVATITLTRSAIGDETCVTVTVTPGSATAGDDFVAVGPFGVFWDPTDASPKTFDVTILGDPLPEGPETVNLQIFGGVLGMFDCGATLGTPSAATLTILDDDNVVTVVIPTVSEWGLLLLAAALGSLALARLHGGAARPRPGSP